MIKKQTIHNFQSHTHSVLKYHSGVNVIIGTGDAGKSSIRRALVWVKDNRPLGDGFIHDDAEDCSVELLLDDRGETTTIKRGRDRKDSNYYTLNGDELSGFGANTPEVVTHALAMEDINFQAQMEPYFLVVKSPGESAHFIRELMGLNVIDDAVSNLAGKIKQMSAIIVRLENEEEEAEKELGVLDALQLDHFQCLLEQTQSLKEKEASLQNHLTTVENKLREYQSIQDKLSTIPDNIDSLIREANTHAEKFNKVDGVFQPIQQHLERYRQTISQIKDLSLVPKLQKEASGLLQLFSELTELRSMISPLLTKWRDLEDASVDVCQAPKLISLSSLQVDEYIVLEQQKTTLGRLLREDKEKQIQLDSLEKEREEHQVEVDNLTSQLVLCPTCGHELTDKERSQIIEDGKNA